MPTANAIARAVSGFGAVAVRLMITEVNTTVIGPVGSEIRVGVPPKSDATRPMITAPHRPAAAPAPDAMPKARAIGKAITAAVTPPKASPRRLLALMRLSKSERCACKGNLKWIPDQAESTQSHWPLCLNF